MQSCRMYWEYRKAQWWHGIWFKLGSYGMRVRVFIWFELGSYGMRVTCIYLIRTWVLQHASYGYLFGSNLGPTACELRIFIWFDLGSYSMRVTGIYLINLVLNLSKLVTWPSKDAYEENAQGHNNELVSLESI